MTALPLATAQPLGERARTACASSAIAAREPQPNSRARSSRMRAITAGLARLMPRPGSFLAAMGAFWIALIVSRLAIFGLCIALCACLAVASDRLDEWRSRAAREPCE